MNILIDIGHPGHVHLFKNVYFELIKRKHKVYVITRDVPIIIRLLNYYNIPFINIGEKKDSIIGKAFTILKQDFKVLFFVLSKRIKVGISSGIVLSHVSKFTSMKTIIFDDDDDKMEKLIVKFGHPFADTVLSPSCIKRLSKKNILYNGIHELAYLHPKYFSPDENVLKKAGLTKGTHYFVLRFVALKGHHDIGHKGISVEQKRKIIKILENKGRIFITAEREIEPEFETYRIPIAPEEMHSFIYYSSLFVGDSQTMTSEASVLGVPALKCNTFAGKLSVPNELEYKYGLCYSFQPSDFDGFLAKLNQLLLTVEKNREIWGKKRKQLIDDKIDVTSFMVWFIENFPESKRVMKENPEFQYNFR